MQLGHHRVEFIHLEMRQDVRLQSGRSAECVAVNLQHLGQGHSVHSRVKVAGIGQQEFEGVAHPAVNIHHARQDFVVNAQVAGVIGTGTPKPDDLGPQLVAHLLRRHHIAHALAHLAALPVDGEAVGQQAAVGCPVVHGTGGQQRAVEPPAVLVMAFQVQVGLRPSVMAGPWVRGFQHRGVGSARVKPDLQDVRAFGVLGGVSRRAHLGQDGLGRGLAPGLDATGFHHLGGQVHDLQGAWVQLTAVFVQEEGHRHAPAALAADAPVGPVGNHVAQPAPPVLGVKSGLLNGIERGLAQGFGGLVDSEHALALVHAHKPLGRSAVNHWRFVTPAVRVAVGDVGGGKQPV